MKHTELEKIRPQIETLLHQAGQTALDYQNQLRHIQLKSPTDIVTEADFACDKIIRDGLSRLFPEHHIRTEESGWSGDADSEYLWILDPIDGTVNYSRSIPFWGISLALLHQGTNLAGWIWLPALNEMYFAARGQGAYCNQEKIQVSTLNHLKEAIVSNGDFNVGDVEKINLWNTQNFAREAELTRRVKCLGSAAVESAFVAAGRLDLYAMTMSYPWDIAAGSLLVEEAGGKVSRLVDNMPLRGEDGEAVLFSNGLLHTEFFEHLSLSLHP
jgi:fructose-1,6-bisphosphatase/inositol monophosphatase family enzyme